MNTIRIVVTSGCIGCEIASHLANEAVKQSLKNVRIEIIDHLDEQYREFIRKYAIEDYPTIMFMKDENVMSIHTGTMAVPQIINEIKLWFN